eukprot:361824-Chlamydomonas_euryale.AAC.4
MVLCILVWDMSMDRSTLYGGFAGHRVWSMSTIARFTVGAQDSAGHARRSTPCAGCAEMWEGVAGIASAQAIPSQWVELEP